MILVSSCLAGMKVRYNGMDCLDETIRNWVEEKKAVMVCPEILGGLSIPREPAEIIGGTGEDVLCGNARVITKSGHDVTDMFIHGAHETLRIAKELGATTVVMKANSPSCGNGVIYDGNFNGRRIPGNGVAAALLKQEGIRILSEDEVDSSVLAE